MCRVIVALCLLVASVATSSAQGMSPSTWKSGNGALLKVLRADAGGGFSGVFLSGPSGPCPVVPYDMSGRVRGARVGFQTSRGWTTDCRVTAVWTGRHVGPATIQARFVATRVGPDGRPVRTRGTEVFQRL
jgi:hypothetical protein